MRIHMLCAKVRSLAAFYAKKPVKVGWRGHKHSSLDCWPVAISQISIRA